MTGLFNERVNPYQPTAHVADHEELMLAPSLDGPIKLEGETTREQIVEVYADRELATGCLVLFVVLAASLVIFLVFNLLNPFYPSRSALVALGMIILVFLQTRRESLGKSQADKAIKNLPSLVGSVRGQIDELDVDLTFGEIRIRIGWMPGIGLGVRPSGLTIGPGIALPAHLFGDKWLTAKVAFEAAEQRLKLYEKRINYIGLPIQHLPSPQTDAEIPFSGPVTYDQFSLAQGAQWFSVGAGWWVIRFLVLLAIVMSISNPRLGNSLGETLVLGGMLYIVFTAVRLLAGALTWMFGRWWIYMSVSGLVREQGLILAGPLMYLESTWENLTLIQSNGHMVRLRPHCFGRDWIITSRMFAGPEEWQTARMRILGNLG